MVTTFNAKDYKKQQQQILLIKNISITLNFITVNILVYYFTFFRITKYKCSKKNIVKRLNVYIIYKNRSYENSDIKRKFKIQR